MTKSTGIRRRFPNVILLLFVTLQRCFAVASAAAQDKAESPGIVFPGTYTWGYANDISEPLNFVGAESRSKRAVVNPQGNTLQGSVTYGDAGRWVGRAIPVISSPSSHIISTSVVVGGEAANPSAYNPFGVTHGPPPPRTTDRPLTSPPTNFILNKNIFIPHRVSQRIPNFKHHFRVPLIPNFDPPQSNFIPHGHHGRSFNRLKKPNLIYNAVDPRYLINGHEVVTRAHLLQRNSKPVNITDDLALKKSTSKRSQHVSSSNQFDQSQIEVFNFHIVTTSKPLPSNNLYSVHLLNASTPIETGDTPETLTPSRVNLKSERPKSLKFVPLNFVKTTPRPKPPEKIYFGPLAILPAIPSRTNFIPLEFVPSTTAPKNKFSFAPTKPPLVTDLPDTSASSTEEFDNSVDRVISDIIRVLPARRGNRTRGNRNDFTRPPKVPESSRPRRPPITSPPKDPKRDQQPDKPEADDEGWTIIKPRFKGSIRRTFFTPPRFPEPPPDVEILPALPGNWEPNRSVVDKALGVQNPESKPHADMPKEESIETTVRKPSDNSFGTGKEVNQESPDEDFLLPTDPLPDHSSGILEDVGSKSSVTSSLSVMTVTSAMTTGVLMTQWLFQ